MKAIGKMFYLLTATLVISVQALGQQNAIDRYFSDFEDREDATVMTLSGKAFDMVRDMKINEDDAPEAKVMKEMASKVTGLSVVFCAEMAKAQGVAMEAAKRIDNQYEELLTVKNGDMLLRVLIDELDGAVKEVVFIGGQGRNLVLASLTGDLNLNEVGKLTQTIAEATAQLPDKLRETDELMVYPNPVKQGTPTRINLTAELAGAKVHVYDATGVERAVLDTDGGQWVQCPTTGMAPGTYVVHAAAGDAEMTGKFIVR